MKGPISNIAGAVDGGIPVLSHSERALPAATDPHRYAHP